MEEVLAKSRKIENTIINLQNWNNLFSPGEMQILYVFIHRTSNSGYFTADGSIDPAKIKDLIREIDLGIWDNYLSWDYDAYRNLQTQNAIGDIIRNSSGLFSTIQNLNK